MLSHLLANPFLLYSFLAAFGASIAGGIIGSYIVVKRIVSISGSISHSMLGGIGVALWLNYYTTIHLSSLWGAVIGSVLLALFIGRIHLKHKEREDSVIAVVWSLGMSVGIILMSRLPSFNAELSNFLLGNIIWVGVNDLKILFILDGIIIVSTVIFHNRFLALCFDEQYMELRGIKFTNYYFLLLSLAALAIVLLIYVVGIILMMSMLVLPISIACRFSYQIPKIMLVGTIINILLSFLGICIAYFLNTPVGPSIALLMSLAYGLSFCFKT
ncbi:MAG: metal ABC transporter permease [Victivallaceae bacterium]